MVPPGLSLFAPLGFRMQARGLGGPVRYLRVSFTLVRHSRAGGNPVITRTPMESRLRGNDLCVAHSGGLMDTLVDAKRAWHVSDT